MLHLKLVLLLTDVLQSYLSASVSASASPMLKRHGVFYTFTILEVMWYESLYNSLLQGLPDLVAYIDDMFVSRKNREDYERSWYNRGKNACLELMNLATWLIGSMPIPWKTRCKPHSKLPALQIYQNLRFILTYWIIIVISVYDCKERTKIQLQKNKELKGT